MMHKGRLEAFSDGVLAIIITIMVLELKVPLADNVTSLLQLGPLAIGYVLSFLYVGIYWNNHHHLLHAARRVSGVVLWANLHLLFWLSLMPFVTGWLGKYPTSPTPTACYGVVLLMSGVAYWFLVRALIGCHGAGSVLDRAIGRDVKGVGSVVAYTIALPLAWWSPLAAQLIYVAVAFVWIVPDRRIERALREEHRKEGES